MQAGGGGWTEEGQRSHPTELMHAFRRELQRSDRVSVVVANVKNVSQEMGAPPNCLWWV